MILYITWNFLRRFFFICFILSFLNIYFVFCKWLGKSLSTKNLLSDAVQKFAFCPQECSLGIQSVCSTTCWLFQAWWWDCSWAPSTTSHPGCSLLLLESSSTLLWWTWCLSSALVTLTPYPPTSRRRLTGWGWYCRYWGWRQGFLSCWWLLCTSMTWRTFSLELRVLHTVTLVITNTSGVVSRSC